MTGSENASIRKRNPHQVSEERNVILEVTSLADRKKRMRLDKHALWMAFACSYLSSVADLVFFEKSRWWIQNKNHDLSYAGWSLYLVLDKIFSEYQDFRQYTTWNVGDKLTDKNILKLYTKVLSLSLKVFLASSLFDEHSDVSDLYRIFSGVIIPSVTLGLMFLVTNKRLPGAEKLYKDLFTADRIIFNDKNLSGLQKATYLVPANMASLLAIFGMPCVIASVLRLEFSSFLFANSSMFYHEAQYFALGYSTSIAALYFVTEYCSHNLEFKNMFYNIGEVISLYKRNKKLIGASLLLFIPTLFSAAAQCMRIDSEFNKYYSHSIFTKVVLGLIGLSAFTKSILANHLTSFEVIGDLVGNEFLSNTIKDIKAENFWPQLPVDNLTSAENSLAEMQAGSINAGNVYRCTANLIGNFTSALSIYNFSNNKLAACAGSMTFNMAAYFLCRDECTAPFGAGLGQSLSDAVISEELCVASLLLVSFIFFSGGDFCFGAGDKELVLTYLLQSLLMMLGNRYLLNKFQPEPEPVFSSIFLSESVQQQDHPTKEDLDDSNQSKTRSPE